MFFQKFHRPIQLSNKEVVNNSILTPTENLNEVSVKSILFNYYLATFILML